MKEINKNVEEVRSIYADILSLNLQELIIKCREYEINIKYNNLHGLDMVIDELLRKICSERNIPTEYENDLYFGVEYDLNQSLWFNY
tara:strand:+ start:363 stop:623 length:261 start_codon:yes stop_codon:yes gene_type:complete